GSADQPCGVSLEGIGARQPGRRSAEIVGHPRRRRQGATGVSVLWHDAAMSPEPERHPLDAEAKGLVHPWPEPPAGGDTIQVAAGIQWIRMPLPFALHPINLWLPEDEGG